MPAIFDLRELHSRFSQALYTLAGNDSTSLLERLELIGAAGTFIMDQTVEHFHSDVPQNVRDSVTKTLQIVYTETHQWQQTLRSFDKKKARSLSDAIVNTFDVICEAIGRTRKP